MEKTYKNEHGETMTMKFENDEVTVQHTGVDDNYIDLITFLTEVQITEAESHALFDFCQKEAGMDDMSLMMVAQEVNQRRTVEHNKVICKMLLGDFREYLTKNEIDPATFTGAEEGAEELINNFVEYTFSEALSQTSGESTENSGDSNESTEEVSSENSSEGN